MIRIWVLCVLIAAISNSTVAQNNTEKDEVVKVFDSFFRAIKERDTIALKAISLASMPQQMFFWTTRGNDQRLQGSCGSTFKGFIGAVRQKDCLTGACRNEFENFSVRVYGRYAVASAEYSCYVNERKENHGLYTIQFHKTNEWKVFNVSRYMETENEYFPESDLKDGHFSFPAINGSFRIPDGWEEMSKLELFKYGYGPYKNLVVNDTLVVKYKLVMAIQKSNENERLLTYLTEAKYGDESFNELINACRMNEIKNYQSKITGGLIKALNAYSYSTERLKINDLEFQVVSQQKSFDNNVSVENISFDASIGHCLISIEGFTDDELSREELFSVFRQYKF